MSHDSGDEPSRRSLTLTPLSLIVLAIMIAGVTFVLLEVLF
jgi:hypothetical protein